MLPYLKNYVCKYARTIGAIYVLLSLEVPLEGWLRGIFVVGPTHNLGIQKREQKEKYTVYYQRPPWI